jgi:hypothetical protein
MPNLENIARTALTLQTVLATTGIGMANRRLGLDTYRNANQLTRLLGDVGSAFAGLEFEIEGADCHFCLQPPEPAGFYGPGTPAAGRRCCLLQERNVG